MATYFMFGKYSHESIKAISAERTDAATAMIEKHGGKLVAAYALLGAKDLVLIVELPDTEQVMKTSVALAKTLGIAFSSTPAVTVETFDKLMSEG